MNIWLDDAIFTLQTQGGISRLWRELTPRVKALLPDVTWDSDAPPDLFISTYYRRAPHGVKSLVLLYDCIHERLPGIDSNHPDAVSKRLAVREASAVVAISETTAADCAHFYGRSAEVAPCGGAEAFARSRPYEVNDFQKLYKVMRPYVLLVGRRDGYKMARALYDAWPLFEGAQAHHIVCVGGEDKTPDDEAFDRAYPHVRIRLDLHDVALRDAYSGATALAYPSLYEGFGLPVLEAMSCGCPVVLGNDGAAAEVAGDAGFYGEPLLPRSYAAALNSTLEPTTRLLNVIKGFERARLYSWDRMAERTAEVIRRLQ